MAVLICASPPFISEQTGKNFSADGLLFLV